ncbi:MAG: helix-turn-helix domain-containing protein [Bacillota bacterium]|nr:helix-turn-helix domain-containing protein [Bacillota bacterium]
MDIKEIIESCSEYIEKNIHERITLDDLSHHAGVSKFYLHRMFKSLTGDSLIDYIQSRKLTSSINELTNTGMRVIDIAMDYGFEYEQSYIRAFKKKFGYTPLKVRNDQISLLIKEKININDFVTVNNSVTYKPFFVFKQKFNLIGNKHLILSKSGDKTANTYGRDFYYNYRNKISNPVNPNIYFGFTDWSNNDNGYIYYVPSLEVSELAGVPEGMTAISIPPHKYVVFRFVGFFRPDDLNGRQVGRLLVHMYSKWIFSSGFKFADTFRFEYIDTTISKDNYCELDIYQPIIPAS